MNDPLFHEWRAYQKLVENDYMGHQKFFQRLSREVTARFHEPVRILDLGCGDTLPMQASLKEVNVSHYCGIDVSETALAHAGAALAGSGLSHTLIKGDILEATRSLNDPFDLVIASFCLHHLQDPTDKQALLTRCRRLLQPGGLFLIIDVFLGENESRDEYLDRFEQQARENYTSLTDPEMTTLITHVRACDYPDSVENYRSFGMQAGFTRVNCLLADYDTLHQLVSFETA